MATNHRRQQSVLITGANQGIGLPHFIIILVINSGQDFYLNIKLLNFLPYQFPLKCKLRVFLYIHYKGLMEENSLKF